MISVCRVITSLCPCPPTYRLSTCCLGLRSPRRRTWWPGSTRGDPHQVKLIFMNIQSLDSPSDTKPKNGEDMAISRVGKDLYKMLIKVSNTNNRKSIVVSFNLYHIYITLTTYSSPTPRSSGTSTLLSWMPRCSQGCPTGRTMTTGENGNVRKTLSIGVLFF